MTRADMRLAAHNKGILAYLTGARKKEPPAGKPNTTTAAFRAGWFSAKVAMEVDGGRK